MRDRFVDHVVRGDIALTPLKVGVSAFVIVGPIRDNIVLLAFERDGIILESMSPSQQIFDADGTLKYRLLVRSKHV